MTSKAIVLGTVAALSISTVTGCGLSARQRQDIARWEQEAVELGHPEVKYQEILDPEKAVGLGFLPFGIGGFYVRRPGLGVTGILFWPLSVTWTAPVAGASARNYNYDEYRKTMIALREEARARSAPGYPADNTAAALDRLDGLLQGKKITPAEHEQLRRRVLERVGNP